MGIKWRLCRRLYYFLYGQVNYTLFHAPPCPVPCPVPCVHAGDPGPGGGHRTHGPLDAPPCTQVTLVLAEDTRHTGKLLAAFGIRTPLASYHTHNERERTRAVVDRLLRGEVSGSGRARAVAVAAGTVGGLQLPVWMNASWDLTHVASVIEAVIRQ